ncbi:MAG: cyclase family protein [Saprospiraceae bacterium]|nr:cyclase family protein [Saprospiraceae bacterium]
MTLIDLSHDIFDGLVTYKGLPAPIICDYWSREASAEFYDNGDSFQIGKIEMVANTGTYLDCPFHRFADGHDLAELPLENCADLEGIVIRAPYEKVGAAVDIALFEGKNLKNKAVLVHTGWSKHWNTEGYFEAGHPYLTVAAAEYLKQSGVCLVGIDSHNIDDTRHKSRPVHTILLRENILIVEHLTNLAALPDEGFYFSAVPPKFKGVGTFPVRAMARL